MKLQQAQNGIKTKKEFHLDHLFPATGKSKLNYKFITGNDGMVNPKIMIHQVRKKEIAQEVFPSLARTIFDHDERSRNNS